MESTCSELLLDMEILKSFCSPTPILLLWATFPGGTILLVLTTELRLGVVGFTLVADYVTARKRNFRVSYLSAVTTSRV